MKKTFTKIMLLLFALIVGIGNTWADDTYVKVTATSQLTAGSEYLIVYENGNSSAACGAISTTSTKYGTSIPVAVSNSAITISNQAVVSFVLGGSSNAWTFNFPSTNDYLTWSSGNSLTKKTISGNTTLSNKEKWTISISNGTTTITNNATSGNTTRYLKYNNTSGQLRFACYTSGQQNVSLYKKSASNTPSIDAANVNVAYNATNGTIAATINNPVDGGVLTASITAGNDGSWLSLGTVNGTNVPLTINSSNDGVISRSATVRLTYTYNTNQTVTKEVTVTQGVNPIYGSSTNPYTVAQAIAVIDAAGKTTVNGKYVTGIICQIDAVNTNSYATYWISDDGTTTTKFEIYHGQYLSGANFTSSNQIQLGDVVVVSGNITYYSNSSIYEFEAGSSIASLKLVAPTFYPAAGAVGSGTELTISDAHTDATIYYTTNGDNPTTSSTPYNSNSKPTITAATTFKAIAVKSGCTNSDVANASYTILTPVETPVITLAGGIYSYAQSTTITCGTEGATIYYTTNGDNPTTSSTTYTEAISINESMTIKAIAAMDGMANSAVAVASYTISIPAINASDVNIAYDATSGTITSTITNAVEGGALTAAITSGNVGTWLSLGTVNGTTVPLNCSANEGNADRTATVTLTYTYSGDHSVTKDVTVTQAHYVKDYADLPFNWTSGFGSAPTGVTNNGVSTDNNGTYLKFDTDEDNIILKINERPGILSYDVKGNPSNNTWVGTLTVETSVNGTQWITLATHNDLSTSGYETKSYALDASVRYVKWTYSKTTGNGAMKNIHLTKGVTVTFNGNGGTYNEATTYTQTVSYNVATELNDNKFVKANCAFSVWNTESNGSGYDYDNGESITITADLTLYAQWVQLYTATVADNIENGTVGIEDGSGISVSLSVPAGTEITLTNTPYSGYIFSEWNVYWMNGENPEPVTVTNNKFNMPAHNVTVSATFTTAPTQVNYAYSINGVLGDIQTADYGTDITLAEGEDLDKTFEFVGWTTDPNDVATASILAPGASYTVNATVEFFAVYGKQTVAPSTMTIDKTTENFPTTYGSNNTFTEYTLNGKRFKIQQAYYNSNVDTDALQFRANGHENGTGTMYNNEDFGDITSIILNYTSKDNKKNFTIKVGTTANPTDGIEITPTHEDEGLEYTFDLGGNYTHFVLTNGTNAGYLNNIIINYSGVTTKYYTRVFVNETATANITIAGPSIIPSGSILDMGGNALNNATAANLIIEDGGQLITTNSVTATVQKEIVGYGTGISDKWYFIASPITSNIAPAAVTNLLGEQIADDPVTYNYDLYRLGGITEGNHQMWENYHEHKDDDVNPFVSLVNGQGYLYAKKANTTLSFAGTVKPYDADLNIPVTEGWNLIGNPYTFDAYANVAYYAMNEAGTGITATTVATSTAAKPCTGIIIYAEENGNVKFLNSAPSGSANNGNLQMLLAHNVATRDGASVNKTIDNAIVSFNEGTKLQKFYFGEPVANIFIPQNGEDYAIAFSNRQGDMPLNFKTTEAGMYTISFEGDNMDLKGVSLIDMLAEEEIDLSVDPSYTFIGSPADKAERFKIVFSPSTDSGADIFAYQSGSDIIVSGEGELQIFDVMGRKVKTQYVSGVQTVNVNAQGVYIMKLNEKTQKIIVR